MPNPDSMREDSVPKIVRVNKRVPATSIAHTRVMKDAIRAPTMVPMVQFEGPLVPTKPIETQGGNMELSVDIEMWK